MYQSVRQRTRRVRRTRWLHTLLAVSLLISQFIAYSQVAGHGTAQAHSVGLRNTRVFMSSDTATTLVDRAVSGGGGVQVGDVLEFIVEFEPFENGAVNGPGGWVTLYPPSGTEVVGASVVDLVDNDFVEIAVPEAGAVHDGPGTQGSQIPFGAPFAASVDGSLAHVYGDTGLFYSTDSRTTKYVGGADPDITPLGNNGYAIDPTGCGQLIPVGWDNCWAHNEWDRFMTDTMGTSSGSIIASGRGNTPFLAGSPVAGPESYYNLDYTGAVGPWQRVQYPGSQIASGPAPDPSEVGDIAPDVATAWVPVTPGVNDGIVLSEANPLPANTTAVRFAIGGLTADEASLDDLRWVKFRLRVLQVPATCIPIDSEVFGGDAGANDGGKDNMWRYHVPISATNNACVAVTKTGPTEVGTDVTFPYTVSFANTSAQTLTNVQVIDTLDPAVSFVSASDGGSEAGGVVTWPTIASLAAGEARQYTVQVTAPAAPTTIENGVVAFSDQTIVVDAIWQTDVVVAGPPSVSVSKSPSPGSVAEPGGTVTFSVVATNTSAEPVTVTSLSDDVFGDLLDGANPNVSSNTCPAQSTALGVGATLSCSFDAVVAGDFGDPDHVDTVTVVVEDDDSNTASDNNSATVTFDDVLPVGTLLKTPSTGTVQEPGATVTFTVDITNGGDEALTIDSLVDDVFGDLLDAANPLISANSCTSLSTTVPANTTVSCSFDGFVSGDFGDPDHVDTVTVTLSDDDTNSITPSDDAVVAFDSIPASIAGSVFLDLDGSAFFDPYEPGFENISVELFDSGGVSVTSTLTASDGSYSFSGLPVGDYTVVVDGAAIGAGYVGSVDPDGVVDDETDESLTSGEAVTDLDFGYRGTASVGDTVWVDENEDGVIDATEPVLPDADVSLTWAGPDGALGTADDYDFGTRVSDSAGYYLFGDLPPGDYELEVMTTNVGAEVEPTTATKITVALGVGQVFVLADFGFNISAVLPFTGLNAEPLILTAALLIGLSGLVLADGRRRERRFDLALGRIEEVGSSGA